MSGSLNPMFPLEVGAKEEDCIILHLDGSVSGNLDGFKTLLAESNRPAFGQVDHSVVTAWLILQVHSLAEEIERFKSK